MKLTIKLSRGVNGRWVVKSMKLDVVVFKEDDGYIAYCPSLELCGSGYTESEAQESFKIVLKEYIRYTTENKTLIADLEEHGWKITNKNKKVIQPKMSELLQNNNELEDMINKQNYKYIIPVKMQVA